MSISKSERAKIVACLKLGRSLTEIARQFGRGRDTIRVIRDAESTINRPTKGVQSKVNYCPTEAEIKRACLEIQAGWSDQEFYSRSSGCNSGTKFSIVSYNMDRCGTTGRAFFSVQG